MTTRRNVKLYNNVSLFPLKSYSGLNEEGFLVAEGARVVFTLHIKSIDAGASVNVRVFNSFSESIDFCQVLTWSSAQVGDTKRVLSDFHNLFRVELEVLNGSAEVTFGLSVYDNALTTRIENAEIQVDLNHQQQANGSYDSVRVGDGEEEMAVNPDGSINVNIVNTSVTPEVVKNKYNKITNVVDLVKTSIASHIAELGKKTYLQFISVSGDNYAEYYVEVDGVEIDLRRTSFGGPISESFEFEAYSENGLEISPGQRVEVFVEHCRPDVGSFNSRIQYLEIG